MTKLLEFKIDDFGHYFLLFGVPLTLFLFLYIFSGSQVFLAHPDIYSPAIILDLFVTIPFIMIWIFHKKKISKIYAAPLLLVGAFVATKIIPVELQGSLEVIKYTLIPFVEVVIVITIIRKVYFSINSHKKSQSSQLTNLDFYDGLKISLESAIPKRVAALAINEIATIYYLLFNWKSYDLKPGEYTYHQKSGGAIISYVFLGLVVVETFVAHVLLSKWNQTFAWVITVISIYTMLQIIGMIRGCGHRPIKMDDDMLHLRYSFINDVSIPIKDIMDVEETRRSLKGREDTIMLSALGELETQNLVLHLKKPHTLNRIYGLQSSFKSIGIFVDEKDKFLSELSLKRSQNKV